MDVIKSIAKAIYGLVFVINGFVFLVAGCCLDSDSWIPMIVLLITIIIFAMLVSIIDIYEKLRERR